MKAKTFFGIVAALSLGLFCRAASAQEVRQPAGEAWDGMYSLILYVDQQDPSLFHVETASGQTYDCDIQVTIDYEKKPEPGEPTDAQGKIIRHFTTTLRAGQTSATQHFPGIIYYPCHNGVPEVNPSTCGGQQITAGFDMDKYFPTFGMEFYPDYQ